MKLSLLTALLVSVVSTIPAFADTAAETKTVTTDVRTAPQPEVRTIEIVGLNGRTTIVINDGRTSPQQAPYALQGSSGGPPAKAPERGYQAR